MYDKNLEIMQNAINYALDTGGFHKVNVIKQADNVCIWGAGRFFREAYERHFARRGIKVDYVIDKDKEKIGQVYFGNILCISPEHLFGLKNPVVIPLLGGEAQEEVMGLCESHGVTWVNPWQLFFDECNMDGELFRTREWFEENLHKIYDVYNMLEDDESKYIYSNVLCNRLAIQWSVASYRELFSEGQYFKPRGIYRLGSQESFIDVGGFEGDSIKDFLGAVDNDFNHIYSFEMSKKNYAKLVKSIEGYNEDVKSKIDFYNFGAWNREIELRCGEETCNSGAGFSISKGCGDYLKESEAEYAKCVRLDTIIGKDKEITLIKMDIEGAEQQALEGARRIITAQKPKLAICIYHSLKDLWEIPLAIKEMVPEYQLAVRHHSKRLGDTVCYAWKS